MGRPRVTCTYCDQPATTWDHVTPRAHGGSDARDNLAPACARCNALKGADSLLVFLARLAPTRRALLAARLAARVGAGRLFREGEWFGCPWCGAPVYFVAAKARLFAARAKGQPRRPHHCAGVADGRVAAPHRPPS